MPQRSHKKKAHIKFRRGKGKKLGGDLFEREGRGGPNTQLLKDSKRFVGRAERWGGGRWLEGKRRAPVTQFRKDEKTPLSDAYRGESNGCAA